METVGTKVETLTANVPNKKPYLVSDSLRKRLNVVDSILSEGANVNVLISGPKGCGKTELVTQYAATRGRPLATIQVGGLSEPKQLFGQMVLKDGATSYQPGLFIKAISTPNAVIHLEELNRPESDKALNAIFSVLDDSTRGIWLDELGVFIRVAEGVSFFATLNEGYEYIGTMPLDVALADRFAMKLTLGYLPHDDEVELLRHKTPRLTEEQAEEIVTTCERLRLEDKNNHGAFHDGSVSTRSMLYIGDYVARGLSFFEAFSSVVTSDKEYLERVLSTSHFAGRDVGYQEAEENYDLL